MRLMTLRTAGGTTGDERLSGYRRGNRSPIGIGGAVAVHALVVGVLLLMPREMIAPFTGGTLTTYDVPDPVPPPPETFVPETHAKPPEGGPAIMAVKPVIDTPANPFAVKEDPLATSGTGGGTATIVTPPVTPTLPDPVLVEASIDPRALAAFQPDYPGAMIRQGMEGKVTVRVAIGPDGHVTGIERLSATDDAFWVATQRHALRKWRFRPATRDGVAIGSSRVLTVTFRLADV
ncbi:energy transducer TonB [Sphingobium estronivorans]|uniref:energy transducer TonB n=1 Tax=Sphingobium estronivorans TaxID=1577690 RepID=UPI00123A7338|nr:energy transducer TonB [Sphingobium estronivorans]